MSGRRPNRRETLAAGALAALGTRAQAGEARPSFLFILADDLGYADVSCYGRREYQTPAIDGLARDGMRFTQAYANSAVCSATRTALITGRYQYRLACGLEEPIGRRDVGLPPQAPTLPSRLKAAGYATSLVGKWHLGAPPKFGPLMSGYDDFYGFYAGGIDYFEHGGELIDQRAAANDPGYLTDLFAARAVDRIEAHARSRKPFLLSLHFNAPHWPWEGPKDQAEGKRVAAKEKKPGYLASHDAGTMQTYAAMVVSLDAAIGRVLAALERLGLARNTVVVFTSDNGGERFSDTWPFTGKKTELLEGGIRVPAIVRWPARVPALSVSEQTIISMDWAPTLLAAAGVAGDAGLTFDGIDLAATLAGRGPPQPRSLFWRYLNNLQEAHRNGDWKYLKILGETFLFNVVDDPLERANWKDRRPDVYARLVAEYRAWDATMLPLDPESGTSGHTGADMADHYGVTKSKNIGELAKP